MMSLGEIASVAFYVYKSIRQCKDLAPDLHKIHEKYKETEKRLKTKRNDINLAWNPGKYQLYSILMLW